MKKSELPQKIQLVKNIYFSNRGWTSDYVKSSSRNETLSKDSFLTIGEFYNDGQPAIEYHLVENNEIIDDFYFLLTEIKQLLDNGSMIVSE